MRSIGQPITESQAKEMIAEVDDDGSGELSFPEFLNLMAARTAPASSSSAGPSSTDLARVFQVSRQGWLRAAATSS